jgi:hypothetical protein
MFATVAIHIPRNSRAIVGTVSGAGGVGGTGAVGESLPAQAVSRAQAARERRREGRMQQGYEEPLAAGTDREEGANGTRIRREEERTRERGADVACLKEP